MVFAKLGVSNAQELRQKENAEDWRRTCARIRAFVEAHGHSRVPEDNHDEDVPLDGLVGNIRLHHSGRSWLGEPPPPRESQMYGSVDWEADLDRLMGWSWELDDPWCRTAGRSPRPPPRPGVSRQSVHTWIARYEAGGLAALADRSHRPTACPDRFRDRGADLRAASGASGVGTKTDP